MLRNGFSTAGHTGANVVFCGPEVYGCHQANRRATNGLTTRNGRSCTDLGMGAGGFQCQQIQLLLIVGFQNIL